LTCTERKETPTASAIARPVQRVVSPGGSAQVSHDPAHQRVVQGRLAGLPGPVAREAVHPHLGVAPLPTPDRRATDPGLTGYRRDAEPVGREQHRAGAGDVLPGQVPIRHDCLQAHTILGRHHGTYGLSHGQSIPPAQVRVDPLYASVH
jgi:hypothetical protein